MRVGKAVGVAIVVLAVAGATVAWAPGMAAQQQSGSEQSSPAKQIEKKTVTVTVDDRNGGEPQVRVSSEPALAMLGFGGPRLGVSIRDVTKDDVTKMQLAGAGGTIIEEVTKDSAAAKAGLKAGDVILQFDGENVRSAKQFTRLVGESTTAHAIKIGVMREGKRMDVEATLTEAEPMDVVALARGARVMAESNLQSAQRSRAEVERSRQQLQEQLSELRPMLREFRMERQPGGTYMFRGPNGMGGNFSTQGPWALDGAENRGRLGVTIQDLTPELATYFGVKDGVLVSAVRADSPAAKAGIKAGDVITTVNEKPIGDGSALVDQLANKDGEVTIGVTRDKKPMNLKATLPKAEEQQLKRKVVIHG